MAVDQPLLRYDFVHNACINGTFVNLGSVQDTAFIRNETTTTCSREGLGIESQFGNSQPNQNLLASPVQPWLEPMQELSSSAPGVTFNFWIRSLQDDDSNAPIFTIGTATKVIPRRAVLECNKRQVDFQLSIYHGVLDLMYRTSDIVLEPCQRYRIKTHPIAPGELVHVAVVLADRHQQVFINNHPSFILTRPFDSSLGHWDTEKVMRFFTYHDSTPWYGRVYQFEVLADTFSAEQVNATISRGLPPSTPYTQSHTFRMNEDGETTPGGNHVEWYEQTRSFSNDESILPQIPLPYQFLQDDVDDLLRSLDLFHGVSADIFAYVTKLPSHGQLYKLDGTTLHPNNETNTEMFAVDNVRLIYIPSHNAHSNTSGSIFDTFEYCLSAHAIFSISQCDSLAIVSIVVDPVNDPPRAHVGNLDTYVVHEGIFEESYALLLNGTDVDEGDTITAIEITSPPESGYLYLSVSSRRDDGLMHGTLLSDLDFVVMGHHAYVEYRFDRSHQIVRGMAMTDSFRFRVLDMNGSWSAEEEAVVHIVPSVNSIVPSVATVREGENVTVRLLGTDDSGMNRTLGYYLKSVPWEDEGRLHVPGNQYSIVAGDILEYRENPGNVKGAAVTFYPSSKLCVDAVSRTVSFYFQVLAYDDDGLVASVSSLTEQTIEVQCWVNPIHLSTSKEVYTIHAFNELMDDPCSGFQYNASDQTPESCPAAAILTDIRALSGRSHTSVARVTLQAQHGLLTINREMRQLIRPLEDQTEMRQEVKFLAEPSSLTDVLSHLHYQSDVVGMDEIVVMVEYGSCIANDTRYYQSGEKLDQCVVTTKRIAVQVQPEISIPQEMMFEHFPWIPIPFTFTMLLLLKLKGKAREVLELRDNVEEEEDKSEASVNRTAATVSDSCTCLRWKQYYDEESGFYYYQNTEDGTVSWDPPLEEGFIPVEDDGGESEDKVSAHDESEEMSDDETSDTEFRERDCVKPL